jgi:nucleotide-binding universal stress UspA family protein
MDDAVEEEIAMTHFIIGMDGSTGAAAALRWATGLALSTGADLHVVNAYQSRYAEVPPEDLDRDLNERAELLAEWTRSATDLGLSVRTHVHAGDPRDMFDHAADDEGAELVVLGRSGAGSAPGLFHIGSVVEHVAHHSSVPLAVIQPHGSGSVERIVLGVDGSDESTAAIRWCVRYAGALNAGVQAVHVGEKTRRAPASAEQQRAADAEILGWTQPLKAAGVEVIPLFLEDLHPADALVGIAARHPNSLVVIGTRGTGGFTGLRLGGVAMKVLHRATTDLVLVPPTAES